MVRWASAGYFVVNGVAIPFFGRLADIYGVDRLGVALPTALGAAACIAGVVLLSGFGVGRPAWVTGALVVIVGVGTTLAKIATSTGVSLAVSEENLPSGISVNEMVWISGASVGTALFSAARSGAPEPLNPLHVGAGVGYSDAFLSLALPAPAGGRQAGRGRRKTPMTARSRMVAAEKFGGNI